MKALPTIYLVRHGETAWSLEGKHTGLSDPPLTAHGEAQARALAWRLIEVEFSHVLVSPRLRAQRTCELAELASVSETEAKLAEWNYGDYEGLRLAEIRKERPNWNVWQDGCPHGETPAELSARVDRLITHLVSMHGDVALFTHGHLGSALAARWLGLHISAGQHFPLQAASLSILGHSPDHQHKRLIELWNETAVVARTAEEAETAPAPA